MIKLQVATQCGPGSACDGAGVSKQFRRCRQTHGSKKNPEMRTKWTLWVLPPAAAVDESHSGSVVETLRIGNKRPRLSSTKFAETRGKLATTWQPLSLCYPCRGETRILAGG